MESRDRRRCGLTSADMQDHPDETPFDAPEPMSGYPLDARERAALEAALEAVDRLHQQPHVSAATAPTRTPFQPPRP